MKESAIELSNAELSESSMTKINVRPFVKWLGGKHRLINALAARIPNKFKETGIIDSYVEPFIGGGAFFIYLKQNFNIKHSYILDYNKDLILTYNVIKYNVEKLIDELQKLKSKYLSMPNELKEKMYYAIRNEYNRMEINYNPHKTDSVLRATYFIFLNRTSFNGEYRVNSQGQFNCSFGKHYKPTIFSKENLYALNQLLSNTEILYGDFELSREFIKSETFVYFDPPYIPLSKTANFTSYTNKNFTFNDQLRLRDFFKEMNNKGAFLLLSNSDVPLVYELYSDFIIETVQIQRLISSKKETRGTFNEVLVRNYTF